MSAQQSLVTIGGEQFTVWMVAGAAIEVTTAAPCSRMGFRRVPLTSKSAKTAIAAASLTAQQLIDSHRTGDDALSSDAATGSAS